MPLVLEQTSGEDAIAPSANFDVVAIASSAGGIQPLFEIISALPAEFGAPVLIVQHLSATFPCNLPKLLAARTKLRVKFADHGEALRAGTVYVAQPDRHLIIGANGRICLSASAKVCFARPAADPLFVSLALCYRERAIGVVLSGRGQDAATGIRAISGAGGVTIAQDGRNCEWDAMPRAAIETGCVNFNLPSNRIADALISLVMVRGAAAWLHAPLSMG